MKLNSGRIFRKIYPRGVYIWSMKKPKNKPFKFNDTRMWWFCEEHEMFKYNWKFKNWGSGVWVQDLDSDGNPIPTGRLGVNWGNLFGNILTILMYLLMASPFFLLYFCPN